MMRRQILLLILFSSQLAGIAKNASATDLGIWSWSQANFATPEARDKMLSFCVAEGISHIDQHVSITRTEEGYRLRNADALKQLLIASDAEDISINALRGERNMFFQENHDRAYAQLEAILAFNRDLPEGSRLAGIKYDVEPYLTDEWRAGEESREKIIRDYLSFLTQAKKLITEAGSDLDLCVDIPFWWDKPEFASSLNGEEKLLIHHIIDLTDWIGIMSYRREATSGEPRPCLCTTGGDSCFQPGPS
ncbi:MAG: hypothetical protein P1U58_08355 [Verrucomicrobiales bacterium]|nr:hypothetical protein [Verrucomicrobiales bacterium]